MDDVAGGVLEIEHMLGNSIADLLAGAYAEHIRLGGDLPAELERWESLAFHIIRRLATIEWMIA